MSAFRKRLVCINYLQNHCKDFAGKRWFLIATFCYVHPTICWECPLNPPPPPPIDVVWSSSSTPKEPIIETRLVTDCQLLVYLDRTLQRFRRRAEEVATYRESGIILNRGVKVIFPLGPHLVFNKVRQDALNLFLNIVLYPSFLEFSMHPDMHY